MLEELSIRIQRDISHTSIIHQQTTNNLKGVYEYLGTNRKCLIDLIFKENLSAGGYYLPHEQEGSNKPLFR